MRTSGTVIAILVVAAFLRLVGLSHRPPSLDEVHYRDEMGHIGETLRSGAFRDHSVRHPTGHAPHGLVGPLLSATTGRLGRLVLAPILPAQPYARDNVLSRLFAALAGVALVLIGYVLSRRLFGNAPATVVALTLAVCPLLVNWSRSEYLDATMALFMGLSLLCAWNPPGSATSFRPALAGAFAGLALATKWSALVLLPFALAAVSLGVLERGAPARRAGLRAAASFTGMVIISSFCFLSAASFGWALFPDPASAYGDPEFGGVAGVAAQVFSAPQGHWANRALGFGTNWAGPLFPIALLATVSSLVWWLKNSARIPAAGRQSWYVLVLVASNVPYYLVNLLDFKAWRAYYPAFTLILASGYVLQRLRDRTLVWLAIAILVTTLPFTLNYGLRLGRPLTSYFGSEFRYDTPLPDTPPMRIRNLPDGESSLTPTEFIFP